MIQQCVGEKEQLCAAPTVIFYTFSENSAFEVREDGSLHLPVVTPSLADTYVCTGQNPAGLASDHTQLVVQG